MPYKDRAVQREYQRKWVAKQPKRSKRAARRVKYAWYKQLKAKLSCRVCGESHPACLHFHHRRKSRKQYDVASMVNSLYSYARILAEIAKCDVLCANCHAKLHVVA